MRSQWILCFVVCLLAAGIEIQSSQRWPGWFSKPDRIDPEGLRSSYVAEDTKGIFNNQVVNVPRGESQVLGDTEEREPSTKKIFVNLTDQILTAYENGNLVYSYLISSGKWDRTPNGKFRIWTKIRSQKMSGGSRELGTYYYLPNVPYILFFYNEKVAKSVGYSIHGTYWHDNFGVPMSHGCINMRTPEAGDIYNWASVGTEIEIFGKYQPKTARK